MAKRTPGLMQGTIVRYGALTPDIILSGRIVLLPLDVQLQLVEAFPETCVRARYDMEALDHEVKACVTDLLKCVPHVGRLNGFSLAHLVFLEAIAFIKTTEMEDLVRQVFTLENGTLLRTPSTCGHYPVELWPRTLARTIGEPSWKILLQESPWEHVGEETRTRFWRKAFVLGTQEVLTSLLQHDIFKQDMLATTRSHWKAHPFWHALFHFIHQESDSLSTLVMPDGAAFVDYMTLLASQAPMETLPDAFHATWMELRPTTRRFLLEEGFLDMWGVKVRVGGQEEGMSPLTQALRRLDTECVRDLHTAGFTWDEVEGGTEEARVGLQALARALSIERSADLEWITRQRVALEVEEALSASSRETCPVVRKRRRV